MFGLFEKSEYVLFQSISAGYLGFTNFMKISDLQNTKHYLKHNRLMISILIRGIYSKF